MAAARAGALPLRSSGRRAGRASHGRGPSSSTSSAPIPVRGCARSRRRSSRRTRRWTLAARRRPPERRPPDVRVPVQGPGHLPGGRRRAVPRPGRVVTGWSARLVDTPLVVVSGSSGAGKSSLVRAGLLPALPRARCPAAPAGAAVVLTPGPPSGGCAGAADRRRAARLARLLVCDQLEELWAPGVDPAERTAFLDAVLGLLDDGIVVRCVAVGPRRPRRPARRARSLHRAARRRGGARPAAHRGRAARRRPRARGGGRADRRGPSSPTPSSPTSWDGPGRCRCSRRRWSARGSAAGGPAHPGRLPGGRRRHRVARAGRRRRPGSARRGGRRGGAPAAGPAGRHRRGRSAHPAPASLAELDLDGDRGSAPDGGRRLRGAPAAVRRRRAARCRARGAADRVAPAGPMARRRRRRPRRPPAPGAGRPGVAAPRPTGRRAVPRRPARRGPRLGRCSGRRADRRGAAISSRRPRRAPTRSSGPRSSVP